MKAKKRYLVFDSGCSVCNQLVHAIQNAAGDKLEAISIYDGKAKSLLDNAYPQGWEHAPYLITDDENCVQAWTGVHAALRLGLLIGPRKAWNTWKQARRVGVFLPPGSEVFSQHKASRRSFLKVGAGLAAALSGISLFPSKASACVPCQDCGCNWRYAGCPIVDRCYDQFGRFWSYYSCDKWDCFDSRSGEYCYSSYNNCGCWECF